MWRLSQLLRKPPSLADYDACLVQLAPKCYPLEQNTDDNKRQKQKFSRETSVEKKILPATHQLLAVLNHYFKDFEGLHQLDSLENSGKTKTNHCSKNYSALKQILFFFFFLITAV